MDQTQDSPLRSFLWIAVLVWLLPLVAWLFVQYENGYFLARPAELNVDRDQGFRLEPLAAPSGEVGCRVLSPGWLGPCGLIENITFGRMVLKEYSADGLELSKVQMKSPSFEFVSLRQSKWSGVDINSSDFSGVDLSSSQLQGVKFTGGLWRVASMKAAVLKDVTFENLRIEDSNFFGAHFVNVHFRGASCLNCDFRDAVFENSSMEGGTFFGSSYNESSVLPFPLDEIGNRHFRYLQ